MLGLKIVDEDLPKLLANPAARRARESLLGQPHIAPLTEFVRKLQAEKGPEAYIPYFDPWDGGVEAEVLFLLEAAGPKTRISGFISRNNPDETAKNFFNLSISAGIERKGTVSWNIVPWYIGDGIKIRPANTSDIASGMESLAELLSLLPKLRAIVLVGQKAQTADKYLTDIAPHIRIFFSPHPSPMFINRMPGNRKILFDSWRAVKEFLDRA